MYDFKPPYFGAAYYPESWPREQIDSELDNIKSHNLNTVRIAEFAWSTMEPREGEYDLSLFREVVDKCRERGLSVIMCTPSAAPPVWMTHKHPEIFADFGGVKMTHGGRRNNCPSNRLYRQYIADIVEVMAREFANDENVVAWQIDNEIETMHANVGCTCPDCRRAYQDYLRRRYGTVEALNEAWGAYTWSSDFSSFDEVDVRNLGVRQPPSFKYTWEQCKNELYADFCHFQADIIRKYTDKPIGTNMMPTMQFDQALANSKMDTAQLTLYIGPKDGQFWYDLYRCASRNRPFQLLETSPSWFGSCEPTGPRLPGYGVANVIAPLALGADTCLYWLFRCHRGGYEMAHGSVIDAWGRDSHVSPEIRRIGAELQKLAPVIRNTSYRSTGVGVVVGSMPHIMSRYAPMTTRYVDIDYATDVEQNIYRPLLERQIRPDVIMPNHALDGYRLLISHRQYTLEEGDFENRILPWIKAGGTWVVGPLSDVFTKDLAKYYHAPFGHLEDWADVRRDYYIPAPNNARFERTGKLSAVVTEDGRRMETNLLTFDVLSAGKSARVVARYADDANEDLGGHTAIVETKVGKGRIILMGAQLSAEAFGEFIEKIAAECGILPLTTADATVATSIRANETEEIFCAVETLGKEGHLTLPFDAKDLVTEALYEKGQAITLSPYSYLFARKI